MTELPAPARGRLSGPQRFFVNGRFLCQPFSGVQRYATEIIRELDTLIAASQDSPKNWTLIVPEGADASRLDLKAIGVRPVGRRRGHAWEQTSLLRASWGGRLLNLCNSGPVLHPDQAIVIHDAAVYRHPEHFGRAYGLLHRSLGRILGRRANPVITVSEFSRAELAEVLGLDPRAIVVAPNGGEHLRGIDPDSQVFGRLNVRPGAYFLTVGNQTANKNLAIVSQAIEALSDSGYKLVRVGAARVDLFGGGAPEAQGGRTVLAGRRDDRELAALYAGATALIFSSLYEGFGIPLLEASVYGCPVIASTCGAAREVCRDRAVYFDPRSVEALVAAMEAAARAGRPGAAEVADIKAVAENYSWRRSARIILDALSR